MKTSKKKLKVTLPKKRTLRVKAKTLKWPIIDKPIEESTSSQPSMEDPQIEKVINITEFNKLVTSKKETAEIDPNKFINMKPKHVKTMLPEEIGGDHDALDDSEGENEEDQHQIISEAFADDDVVDEFRKEKEEEVCFFH